MSFGYTVELLRDYKQETSVIVRVSTATPLFVPSCLSEFRTELIRLLRTPTALRELLRS